jgi:hypothetical protein
MLVIVILYLILKLFESIINVSDKPILEKGLIASEFILSEYSIEMEVKTIISFWEEILK